MTFGTILTVILIGYALYYGGNIIHDMFFDKSGVVEAIAMEEEEIDISSEAENFQPVEMSKEELDPTSEQEENGEKEDGTQTQVSGGIEADKLESLADELAENGEDSVLGGVAAMWSVSNDVEKSTDTEESPDSTEDE